MRRALVVVGLVSAGCSWIYSPDKLGDSASADGGRRIDAMSPDAAEGFTYAPSNVDPDDYPGTVDVVIGCALSFDTDTRLFTGDCDPGLDTAELDEAQGVLLAMSSLTVSDSGSLVLRGSVPVIFLVHGDAVVDGTISAAASLGIPGAGGNANCSGLAALDGANLSGTGGGGAGGSYGSAGSDGGVSVPGAAGGNAGDSTPGRPSLDPARGGCPGGVGGAGDLVVGGIGGLPGAGGGALQISAAGTLTVGGVLTVSGGGGGGGVRRDGGGGGGSGGGLLVEAQTIVLTTGAALTANGGGGGEAGANSGGCQGELDGHCEAGSDGSATTDDPAPGGSLVSATAGDGGDGAAGIVASVVGGNGVSGLGGGGGGGGGLGRIRLNSATSCELDDVVVSGSWTGTGTACEP